MERRIKDDQASLKNLEVIKQNEYLKGEIQYLTEALNKQFGPQLAKTIIDKAKMEYAIIKTNEKLEKRDWN